MSIYNDILSVYKNFDEAAALFQSSTFMRCPSGCSICCIEGDVEATALELLPLAAEIYSRRQEEVIMSAILERQEQEDSLCVLFNNALTGSDAGPCGYYDFRPLVCRLFGFASRRNRSGDLELMTCRIIRERFPVDVAKAGADLSHGVKPPVYQDAFMSISSMKPGVGTRRLPINKAIKEVIEGYFWFQQIEKGEDYGRHS
jgi:uncharacterized protein